MCLSEMGRNRKRPVAIHIFAIITFNVFVNKEEKCQPITQSHANEHTHKCMCVLRLHGFQQAYKPWQRSTHMHVCVSLTWLSAEHKRHICARTRTCMCVLRVHAWSVFDPLCEFLFQTGQALAMRFGSGWKMSGPKHVASARCSRAARQ